jgi:hypothetical protein
LKRGPSSRLSTSLMIFCTPRATVVHRMHSTACSPRRAARLRAPFFPRDRTLCLHRSEATCLIHERQR